MKNAILVTASDHGFFELALSLIASLRDLGLFPRIPLAMVDVGLTSEQRRVLNFAGVKLVNPMLPKWWRHAPADDPGAASLLTRPYYRDMFTSAEVILHVDADIWLADAAAIDAALDAARASDVDLAAAVHDHPSYRVDKHTLDWRAHMSRVYASRPSAFVNIPPQDYVNAGFFAARRTSPLWAVWQRVLARSGSVSGQRIDDQAALNVAIAEDRLRLHRLDASCNWLTHLALPAMDPASGRLVAPAAPHVPLSAIHVSGTEKLQTHSLEVVGGGALETSLDRMSFYKMRDRWLRRRRR